MSWSTGLLGFLAGPLIPAATAPVGVPGAVFLLPVQVGVLGVPSPAVTPTNLPYNVVSCPTALLRHRNSGRLRGPLTRLLALGTGTLYAVRTLRRPTAGLPGAETLFGRA